MTERPNVLWISLEDVSPRFGCYGDPVARTPHLDRLAAQGCLWTRAFSAAPVCAPSRCGIITGMWPTAVGAHHMRTTHRNRATPEMVTPYSVVAPHYVKCFSEYLRLAGWYCTNNEKTDYQFTPPASAWDELGPQAHWRNRAPGQPFFAVFNPTVTHESGMWSRESEPLRTDPDAVTLPPWIPDTPRCRRALARHYDNLELADARVGELLQQLDDDGLADSTAVMIWSDHGEGIPRGKRWPYDSGLRVPLIVRWPGALKPGSVRDDLVSMIDLGPTVLGICGVEAPAHLHGRAFIGPTAGPARDSIFGCRDRFDESYDMVRAVRDRRFKYIRNYRSDLPYVQWIPYSFQHPMMQELWRLHRAGGLDEVQGRFFQARRPAEEFYDLAADPHEIRNLAGDPRYADDLRRLREELDGWRARVGDLGELPESEMVARMWPGGEQPRAVAPVFAPVSDEHSGIEAQHDGGIEGTGPLLLLLHSPTQGASISYASEAGDAARWRLYGPPLRLERGEHLVRARCSRIGYLESEERSVRVTVR